MSNTISFSPFGTTAPQDTFLLQTQGYVQGFALDDPTARMELMGGQLALSETSLIWGGVPVTELINLPGAQADGLGPQIKRATAQGGVTGFSTYNQAYSMVITPGATAPAAAPGDYVAFFRLGSNARIAVAADPALVTAITSAGDAINAAALYWDPTNNRITQTTTGGTIELPTSVRLLSVNTNSKIVSLNNGAVTWTTGPAGIILI